MSAWVTIEPSAEKCEECSGSMVLLDMTDGVLSCPWLVCPKCHKEFYEMNLPLQKPSPQK